jgi:hypothetical protein
VIVPVFRAPVEISVPAETLTEYHFVMSEASTARVEREPESKVPLATEGPACSYHAYFKLPLPVASTDNVTGNGTMRDPF